MTNTFSGIIFSCINVAECIFKPTNIQGVSFKKNFFKFEYLWNQLEYFGYFFSKIYYDSGNFIWYEFENFRIRIRYSNLKAREGLKIWEFLWLISLERGLVLLWNKNISSPLLMPKLLGSMLAWSAA